MAALQFRLAQAVTATQPPPIPIAKAWGAAYTATPARPLIHLSQGVPGVPPPRELLDAVAAASGSPQTCGYGPVNGEVPMRDALVAEMKVVYGADADITRDDVSLSAGCNMGFMAVAMTLAEPGDEVILPVPWMTLQMLGVRIVPLLCRPSEGFIPAVSDCAQLITARTRAVVLVSPNNPTGAVYPPEVLASFAALAAARGIALVVEETYRDLIPYCGPGHRLGAIVASPAFLGAVDTVLDCMQICPPRPVQAALAPLLAGMRPGIRATAEALVRRHAVFRGVLPRGWRVGSQGGYYAFVRHPFEGVSAREVSMVLARDCGVVTLPATIFGMGEGRAHAEHAGGDGDEEGDSDRWIRFSIANVDEESLRRVGERLAECGRMFGVAGE